MPLPRVRVEQNKTGRSQPEKARSKVTNRTILLPNIDGRSWRARRYKDIEASLIADQGGIEKVSEVRLQLIRRFAATTVLVEELESALARGEEIDRAEHAQHSSTLVRLCRQIGVGRVRKDKCADINPLDYVAGRHQFEDDDE